MLQSPMADTLLVSSLLIMVICLYVGRYLRVLGRQLVGPRHARLRLRVAPVLYASLRELTPSAHCGPSVQRQTPT